MYWGTIKFNKFITVACNIFATVLRKQKKKTHFSYKNLIVIKVPDPNTNETLRVSRYVLFGYD